MGKFRFEKVDPDELRFTQDSIASYLRHGDDQVPLEQNLKMLKSGQLQPHDFPPLEVYRAEDGVLWCKDNRRLWLFRMAKIEEIIVKVYSMPLNRAPPEMKEDRDWMSKPYYFPRLRRKWEQTYPRLSQYSPSRGDYTTNSAGSISMAPTMVKENPNAIRFTQNSIDGNHDYNSTFTQPMEDNSPALLIGAVATASGLFMGFGILPALVMGFVGWMLSKK